MWDNIFIETNLIEKETEKALLIKMPKSSNFKGYTFWHPKKLIRFEGKNGHLTRVSFTDDFIFAIKKYGKGKYNYNDLIAERTLDTEEFKIAFGFTNEILKSLKDDE